MRASEMKWCCNWFKVTAASVGERGAAIYYSQAEDCPGFRLQFRSIDKGAEAQHTEIALTITEVQLHYCPWCGASLPGVYKESLRAFFRPELEI